MDFEARKVVDWVCIRTKPDPTAGRKTDDLVRRYAELAQGVSSFMERNRGVVAIEAMTPSSYAGKSSFSSIGMLMGAYGAIIGALGGKKPIPLMPGTVKARVAGHKGASKQEAWNHTAKHFTSFPPLPKSKPAIEAIQDATAVGYSAMPEVQQIYDSR